MGNSAACSGRKWGGDVECDRLHWTECPELCVCFPGEGNKLQQETSASAVLCG